MEITTEYSSWFLILCAVLAGLYTFILYVNNRQNDELSRSVLWFLSVLRFSSIFVLSALLLNPFVRHWVTQSEPPIIIFAQDQSASIRNNADSSFYSTRYPKQVEDLKRRISQNYTLVSLAFADEVVETDSISFLGKRTNFSQLFDEIDARYAGSNIGAVILASDGLVNAGANPQYYHFKQSYPVFTVGLGDTTTKSDVAIVDIRHNDLVYLGNSFPVEISIAAELLKGKNVVVKAFVDGKMVESRSYTINRNRDVHTERFVFEATREGTQRVYFTVTEFANELNTRNNKRQILVDVLDNRDKILLLVQAPHPDIAALRLALEEKETYEIDVQLVSEFSGEFSNYNLVIAHGFGHPTGLAVWNSLIKSTVPAWLVLYAETHSGSVNSLNLGFEMSQSGTKSNRVQPVFNTDFKAFKISDDLRAYMAKVPPLTSPFAEVSGVSGNDVVMYQKLGAIQTDFPLHFFTTRNQIKTSVLYGEGVWRWKLFDYQEYSTTMHFNEWVQKTVQYLSVKEDKSRFRVKVNKHFFENENVLFQAEFYDKSYERTTEEDIELVLNDEAGNLFTYAFNPAAMGYVLDVGKLPPGVYDYTATVNDGSQKFTRSGSLVVKPVDVEWTENRANFAVLQKLAQRTNGQFFSVADLNNLADIFNDTKRFPSISYTSEQKREVIHYKWIFVLIVVLLSLEWLTRKMKGRQ